MRSRIFPPLAACALAGCVAMVSPTSVRLTQIMPNLAPPSSRELEFPVVIERFVDERTDRAVLGYKMGFNGDAPIILDGDLSEAVEKMTARILEGKGIPRGASVFTLRGAIQRAGVSAMPLTKNYQAEVAIQLTLVNSTNRARLWSKTFTGRGVGGDPQVPMSMALRGAAGAIEADDSILTFRDTFLAAGGRIPKAGAAPAAPAAPEPAERASDVDRVEKNARRRPADFALVVGIERYQTIPEAQYAERDASVFKRYAQDVLGVPEENVILLTGSRATRTGVAKYLEEWLPRNVGESSRVYFYYSGHGAPDPVKGTAYLIPWDGDPAYLETSAYPVSRLYEKLGALKAKEVVVALDSCFSGAGGRSVLAKGARPLVSKVDMGPGSDPKLTVLTAAGGEEIAGALDEQGHGLFTYYLLKGLKGEAAEPSGRVTIGGLRDYLDANVRRAARRQNREQTPQLKAADASLVLY